MKALILALALTINSAWADTTPNLITNQWGGISVSGDLGGQHPISVFGCCTSFGSGPFLDNSTGNVNGQSGQIIWSYDQATVSQIIAVNQALSGTGIMINGYNWGYEVRNMNGDDRQGGVDQLTAQSFLKHINGTVLLSATQTYRTKQEWNWHGGTVTATSPYALADVGQLGIQFTSMDSGFWSGYYGPQVRNVGLSLNYTVDQCAADPLSSSSCPGYQQALFTQQCSANPLSDPACPGYATAYHDQQCAANPLYATTCAGYQQAYFAQQCTANPLYDMQCPGYQQAYFDQQCSNNALYSQQCPGYQQAYFDQQCSLDPFYSEQCPGYAQAYFDQQCGLNSLYDTQCPGYAQAYYDQQCGINPLYDSGCPNYDIVARATQPPAVPQDSAEPAATNDVTDAVVVDTPADTAATEVTSLTSPTSATSSTSNSTTSATSPTSVSPAAVVSVVSPPAAPAAPAPSAKSTEREAAKTEARASEKKAEEKKTQRAVARLLPRVAPGGSTESSAAASTAAAEQAQEAVEQAATATTIEAQQAAQNLVMGLMGFNPAFAAYQNSIVPDVNAATMARQYNQPTVDNRRALRALSGASDRLHQDMVDQQYGRTYQ